MRKSITLAIAAALISVALLLSAVVFADNDRAIPAIGVGSPNPGELSVVWSGPADTDGHKDYRLSWSTETSGVHSWSKPNTETGGNHYPGSSATSRTITGLPAGTYHVALRARYTDNGSGPWKRSAAVTVTGVEPEPEAENNEAQANDDKDEDEEEPTTRESETPTPEPVPVTPEPEEEEPQTAQQQQAQDSVTLPSNTLVSNINQSPGSPVTVSHPIGQVSIPIAIPFSDDIRGYRIDTIKIRVSGIGSGEVLSGILYDRRDTEAPLIALGRSKYAIGNATIRDGIATFSPPSSLVLSNDKHLRISVSAGSADIGLTSSNSYDQTPISTWAVSDVYQRTGNLTWAANSNPAQVLIAGAAVSRPPAPPPPPRVVPSRPRAPNIAGATTYSAGRWQSVSLDSTGDTDRSGFGRGLYKVALAQNTTYRLDSNTSRTLPCSISWARNTCSVLLAKGLSSTSIPRATFQRMSKSARALASASLTLSWDWSRRAVASRLGGTLSRPLSAQ